MRRIFGDATACRERVHREGYIPPPRRAAPNSRLLPSVFVAHSSRHRPRKHSAARLEPLPAAPPVPLYRRLPWVAVATTLLVIAAAAVAEQPIRDAANLGSVPEAHLDLSIGYLAIAPISDVLDTLTLLGARQHIVVLVSIALVYAAIRVWRAHQRSRHESYAASLRSRVVREVGYAGLSLLLVIAVYAAAAVAPRSMAALVAEPSDVLLVADFHSHTKFSHDGRPGWEPADVRAWHRAAGFDVAYISDHRTVQGAESGIADNPAEAGQGTMLLQALEVGWRGEHVNVLSANRVYKGVTTADLRDIDERALSLASLLAGREPIVVETFPGRLDKIVAARGPGTAGVRAIELVDGSPRGLDETRIKRSRIVHLADSLNIAVVAGSDNHGWGRAAPGWTLLIVPGWRGMRTDSLATSIERSLRVGREATRVIERRVAGELNEGNALELVLTLPVVTWRMLTTLSIDERVMWIVWVWLLTTTIRLTSAWRRRRRLRVA